MIIHYTIKGVKKGHKKYKAYQIEKERRYAAERSQLPETQDPSQELEACWLAENRQPNANRSETGRTSSDSSESTANAEDALENDPDFQKYMETQRRLYLERHMSVAAPPSYDTVVAQSAYCEDRNAAQNQSGTTFIGGAEMPAPAEARVVCELGGTRRSDGQQPVEADSVPICFELPGDLPAAKPHFGS